MSSFTDDISLEDVLIFENIDFRVVSGAKGQQLNIKTCPNCGGDNWKVYGGLESGLGNCFAGSCQISFNVFSFVRYLLKERGGEPSNRDVGNYINEIRRKLGYRPKTTTKKITVAVEEGDLKLPESAALPYKDGWLPPYLLKRGINGDYAERFHLRYSIFGSHRYKNELGEPVVQSFAERIIIPVYNLHGELVTFQGRDVTGTSDTRYKFAGGLAGTGRYLYNAHTAMGRRSKHVLMVEGPFDAIGAQKALDSDYELSKVIPVGSFGMHLSSFKDGEDQIQAFQKLHRNGLETVTIMWDPEPKAYDRALQAAELLLKIGLNVRIALLSPGTDPGDADAAVICKSFKAAQDVTRLSLLRLRMHKPFAA